MRLQLALNVDDLDEAIRFYSAMFATEPAKVRPGYANFAVSDPPLKLVLFEGAGAAGSLNHLGVEVEEVAQVTDAEQRLATAELAPTPVADATCCFAAKTETWVDGPDGTRWEWYLKVADVEPEAAPATCCS